MGAHPLAKEMTAYEKEKFHLESQSEGKFALIHGDCIEGVWDTYEDALKAGYAQFGLELFLVKQIHTIEPVRFFTRNLAFEEH